MMKYMIEMITISLQTQHGIIKQDNAQNDIPAMMLSIIINIHNTYTNNILSNYF